MADNETPSKPKGPVTRDELTHRARELEEARQQDVVDAVAIANEDELPALGGPLLEPGLGK